MSKSISNWNAKYLGLTDYDKALTLQTEHLQNKSYTILGLEHPTVMTLGLRAHNTPLENLTSKPWTHPVFKISRGGLATIHNPGQLVIYPILNLKEEQISVKCFVQALFETTQKTLAEIGIQSDIDIGDQPGVYTKNGKIAFCGLQVKNGITMHGLSINISNDIALFNSIQSCGVLKPQIDSVENHNVHISLNNFFNQWLNYLPESMDLRRQKSTLCQRASLN